jgi:hypothetical protein
MKVSPILPASKFLPGYNLGDLMDKPTPSKHQRPISLVLCSKYCSTTFLQKGKQGNQKHSIWQTTKYKEMQFCQITKSQNFNPLVY